MSPEETLNAAVTRRWFTEGWTTNPDLAEATFSPRFITNGLEVGIKGPKDTVLRRIAAFSELTTEIEDLIAKDDQVVVRVLWRGVHSGDYAGVPASGKRVELRVFSIWRFEDGKVVDNWTVQDQFTLLQQVGYLPVDLTTAQGRSSKPL
ncbi:MAG: ester cyclase [Pseudomonadota bacterium]